MTEATYISEALAVDKLMASSQLLITPTAVLVHVPEACSIKSPQCYQSEGHCESSSTSSKCSMTAAAVV